MPYHVCRCGFTWHSFRELFESVRTAMAWPEDSWLAGGAWIRSGDDRAAECETRGTIPEAPAGREGGEKGVVEVGPP